MKFGPVPLADAEGAILAHSIRWDGGALKKGRVLAEAHRVFGHYRPGFMACVVLVMVAFVGLAFLPRGRATLPGEG